MAKQFSTDGFTKDKIEVVDPNASMTFGKKRQREDFDATKSCIIFTGFPGSGREELAELLAQKLPMQVATPKMVTSADELRTVCQPGIIVVLPHDAIRNNSIQQAIREHGKVFYMMAEVLRMAHRLEMNDEEREKFSIQFVELEPLFMTSLHFILQAWKEPDELVENVLEMLNA